MRAKAIILLIAVFVIAFAATVSFAYSQKADIGSKTEMFIQASDSELKSLASKAPEDMVSAQVSLGSAMPISEIVDIAKACDITILEFSHIDKGTHGIHVGGFRVDNPHDIKSALKSYHEKHMASLEQNIKDTETDIANISDKKESQAYKNLRADLMQLREHVKKEGIKVYGVKVRGKAKVLLEARKNQPSVRCIRVINKNSGNAIRPILPRSFETFYGSKEGK